MDKSPEEILNELNKVLGDEVDKDLLAEIITTIKNRVNTDNQRKLEDITERISKSNEDITKTHVEIKEYLPELIDIIKTNRIQLPEVFDVIVKNQFETIKVSNLNDIQFPKFPDKFTISNLKDIPSNEKGFNDVVKAVRILTDLINTKEQTVNLDRYLSANKPLAVRLSDGKQFYSALLNAISSSSGDGSIMDGVSNIKATVLDYTNSNPLAVRLTDTDGNYVGAGAGTQYSDGDANADPTGTVAMGTDGVNVFALTTDTSGHLQVDVLSGGGDGAIVDGANSAIKATVHDYTNSNPLAVTLKDTNGDYVSVGGGTQYTEDDASAANPVGNALMMVRDDALSGQTTTDGDNIAARGTDKGELYVKHTDAIPVTDNGGALTVDGTVTVTATDLDIRNLTNTDVVTAELSAVDNAVLDDIAADTEAIKTSLAGTLTVTGGGGGVEYTEGDVDTTITGSVAMMEVASNVIQPIQGTVADGLLVNLGANNDVTVSGNVAVTNAGITTIAGAVSGTEMQVDVLTMPTTTVQATNLDIRDLTSASDSVAVHGDVGVIDQLDLTNSNPAVVAIVDGNGDQITSFGGGVQYTEGDTDATITGTALLFESNTGTNALSVVSNSAPLPISDAGGAITVDGTVAVTNADLTSIKTAVELLDNSVDGNYLNVNLNYAGTDAPTGGGTESGVLRVTIANDSTGVLSVDDNGGALTVDGTVTANLSATDNGVLDNIDADTSAIQTAVELIDDAIYTDGAGTPSKAIAVAGTDGTNPQIIKTDASGELQVDILSSALPTGASTSANQSTIIGHLDGVEGLLTTIDGDTGNISTKIDTIAGAVSGTEVQVDVLTMPTTTVQATNLDIRDLTSASDSVAVLQATHDNLNLNANLQVANTDVSTTNSVPTKGTPSDIDINGSNANHADKYYTNAGAVTDGIVWSPAAGKRWHVLTLYINVSAAATVTLEDDLAGGDVARWKGELAANSGVVLTYDKEHPFCSGEDAADLIITTSAGNVYVQAVGYEV